MVINLFLIEKDGWGYDKPRNNLTLFILFDSI